MRFWVGIPIVIFTIALVSVSILYRSQLAVLLPQSKTFQVASKISAARFTINPVEMQKAVDSTKLFEGSSLGAGLKKIQIEILDSPGLEVLNYGVLVNSKTQAKKIAYGYHIDRQNKLLTIQIAVDFSAYPNKGDREAILNKWVLLAIKQISQNRFDRESMVEILNESMSLEPAQIPKIITQVQ
ncbi:hypothetical protein HYU89_00645 [Candidatus Collierbacteria bacterium]|nr:hypothetical protein [Candidatus Collierbacteria bacterium]